MSKTKWILMATAQAALLIAGAGCTKSRDYKPVFKDNVFSKDIVDTGAEYIYVPSITQASRGVGDARPAWEGDTKLVKFQFSEKSLDAYEIEQDSRFSPNPTNKKPVLSIPIEHKAYRCALNSSDECSNKEEENNDLTWKQKPSFKTDFAATKVQEVNLPLDMQTYFSKCYTETGSQIVNYTFEKSILNIEVEKTYRVEDMSCLEGSAESLSDLTFASRNIYSFVRRDAAVSANYQPVAYPESDQTEYGFFLTEKHDLSVDNNDEVSGKTFLLNRWNPERKEVVYTMSEAFNKPENAGIKKNTYAAFAAINDGMARAGAKIRFKLVEPTGAVPGDLRSSMIVLVEDPSDGGLLGYGPTVADPKTGEIFNGRVAMYSGNMKKYIKRAYDEYVQEKQADGAANADKPAVKAEDLKLAQELLAKAGANATSRPANPAAAAMSRMLNSMRASSRVASDNASRNRQFLGGSLDIRRGTDLMKSLKEVLKPARYSQALSKSAELLAIQKQALARKGSVSADSKEAEAALDVQGALESQFENGNMTAMATKHGYYTSDVVNFNDIVSINIGKKLKDMKLKVWDDLTQAERDRVVSAILPEVWLPVLIHELGHNMGLRHNFNGSEDKANFYTAEERAKMGVVRDFPYSSVMDYGFKELDELRAVGKYDVAAFRFGYVRKVEAADGSLIDIPNTLTALKAQLDTAQAAHLKKAAENGDKSPKPDPALSLRDFMYCTDENVGVSAGCRRFDEGTTYTEIAQFLANSYEKYYHRRNFRNGSRDFTNLGPKGDQAYIGAMAGYMTGQRVFMEVLDRVRPIVEPLLNSVGKDWSQLSTLTEVDAMRAYGLTQEKAQNFVNQVLDIYGAAKVAEDFLIKVILTPETICAVAPKSDPTQIGQFVALKDLDDQAISCFDSSITALVDRISKGTVAFVAEGGRHFNSMKAKDNPNAYADQIDVRGSYIDKILAARALLRRVLNNSSFDKTTGNFIDVMPDGIRVAGAIESLIQDQVDQPVSFRTVDNQVTDIKMPNPYQLSDGHMIEKLLDGDVAWYLGLPGHEAHFTKKLVSMLRQYMPGEILSANSKLTLDAFSIYSTTSTSALQASDFQTLRFGNETYLAVKPAQGSIGSLIALELFELYGDTQLLEKVAQKKGRIEVVLKEALRNSLSSTSNQLAGEAGATVAVPSTDPSPTPTAPEPVPAPVASPAPEASPSPEASPAPAPAPEASPTPVVVASPKAPAAEVLSDDEKAASKIDPSIIQNFKDGKLRPSSYYLQTIRMLSEAQ